MDYVQKKTSRHHGVKVIRTAEHFLSLRGADTDRFFPCMPDNAQTNRVLKRWATKAGFEGKVTFHMAQHTCATTLVDMNVPIKIIAKVLGHSKIGTTAVYAKINSKVVGRAMDKMEGILD